MPDKEQLRVSSAISSASRKLREIEPVLPIKLDKKHQSIGLNVSMRQFLFTETGLDRILPLSDFIAGRLTAR